MASSIRAVCCIRQQLLVPLVLALVWSCDPNELEGTYEEVTPIPADREFAYKLDLFRFGDEVGGVVRFFRLGDGFNRPNQPFLTLTDCAHFGPADLDGNSFSFTIDDGPEGEQFDFLITSLDAEDIQAELIRTVQGAEDASSSFSLFREEVNADDGCTRPRAFELPVALPPLSVNDAANLTLAVAFAGYRLQGDQRIVTRTTMLSEPVGLETDDESYVIRQSVQVEGFPPQGGLSDVDDGTTYGLGYVVLFDDRDGDGGFLHADAQDEIIALSPTQVIIFVGGPAEALHPTVASVFTEGSVDGYWLYSVEREIDGGNAFITQATALVQGAAVRLRLLDAGNPIVYPVLLP